MARKLGRPPRRDHPAKVRCTLPGRVRKWLRLQGAREGRDQSSIVLDGLMLYQQQLRGKP
ncbi:MAG TPA: hypothetical protein VGK93_06970 [Candidatus Eisenbacteria bacterium]|jgi:hypothetical protein